MQQTHVGHHCGVNFHDDDGNEESYDKVHKIVAKKQIKLDDDGDSDQENIINIHEKHDMNLGPAGKIWECSMVLGKYLMKQSYEQKINLKGKKIIDLGCGTGIVGIMLGILGANVLCTDLSPAQSLCEQNIDENKQIIEKNGGQVRFQILDWRAPVIKIQENLKQFSFDKDVSFIIASDIIYNSGLLEIFPKFLRTLYDIIKDKNDIITFMSHKGRHDQIDNQLVDTFEKLGFWGEQVEEEEMNPIWRSKRIDIFLLS